MYEFFACGALRKRIVDNIDAAITWEAARSGLTALPAPGDTDADILEEFNPFDNREGPIIEVYDEDTVLIDARNRVAEVSCTIAVKKTHADQDLQNNQRWMQRYAAVLRRCVEIGPHKLSFVSSWATDPVAIHAEVTDGGRDYPLIDESQTRDTRVVGVLVTVFDQGN